MEMKCRYCVHYMKQLDTCKFCSFEYDRDYNPFMDDDWDIFNLPDEGEWLHKQLMDRLKYKGIECLFADIWSSDSIAFIIGCNVSTEEISSALNISTESIYNDFEHMLVILNLYQEKHLREGLNDL